MTTYILKRLAYGLLVMGIVTVLAFVLMRSVPGDAISLQLEGVGATQELIDQMRAELGFDDPIHVQLGSWVGNALQGDLGQSLWTGEDVTAMFARRVPVTLQLGAMAMVLAIVGGLILGIISAVKRGGIADNAVRVAAVAGLSVPNYVVGLLLLIFVALWWQWSPPIAFRSFFDDPVTNLQTMVLPAIALASSPTAGIARMVRSSMLEAMGANYIRTVRARGVLERVVILKHALRNSTIPVLTLIGVQLGTVLAGTVILEAIFSIPGTGALIYDAVLDRDYPVVVASTLFYAMLVVGVMLIIDLLYAVVDPRVRTGSGV